MKSNSYIVQSGGGGMAEALVFTEKSALERGLAKKSALHLRLLAEELFGMLRSIAGNVEAEYWIESEGDRTELNLLSYINVNDEIRKQFIEASSEKKNAAAKGVMGKIKIMIANALFSTKEALPYAMMNVVSAYPGGGIAAQNASVWSMSLYKEEIQRHIGDSDEAREAWDELEKSIIANIADDIKVSIVGDKVHIVVSKTF